MSSYQPCTNGASPLLEQSDSPMKQEPQDITNDINTGNTTTPSDESNEYETDDSSSDSDLDPDPWDKDEYPPLKLNYDALKHIARYFIPGPNHGKVVKIKTLARGGYHELRRLRFQDGWTCLARFTRDRGENFAKSESGYATMEFVRRRTSIPVPEVWFRCLDKENAVGAAFVLMEEMAGHSLSKMWKALRTTHRIAVVCQIAEVVAQLAGLRFGAVGSITGSGDLGKLQSMTVPDHEDGRGPFASTHDYFMSFVPEDYEEVRAEMTAYLKDLELESLHAPYRLIHGDLDIQNFMFTWASPDVPPKLSAVIDWDYSFTGPLYYLCEYPAIIMDQSSAYHAFREDKVLRKAFVRALASNAADEDKELIRECFRRKNFALRGFNNYFLQCTLDADTAARMRGHYLEQLKIERHGANEDQLIWSAYGGGPEWEPDSELDDDEEVGSLGSQTDSEDVEEREDL